MPDTDLVVELDDVASPAVVEKIDTKEPIKVEAEPEKKEPLPDPVAELKSQMETLKAQGVADVARAQEEARRATAEAKEAKEKLEKASAELSDSNVSAVENAIAAARAEADGFQREQAAAFAEGDFTKAADFGRKMARSEAKIAQLEEGKANLVEAKPAPKQNGGAAQPDDPFEAVVSSASPRAQTWLRQHKEYVTDPAKARKAQIAHLEAIDQGHVVDSDAYFDYCERKLGLKQEPLPEPKPEPKPQARVMPGAPVSRESTPTGGQTSPTQISLTPGEQRAATDGSVVWERDDPKGGYRKGEPVGLKEYARRKMLMSREGRYGSLEL